MEQNKPGEIVSRLVKEGLLTEENVDYVLRVRSKLGPDLISSTVTCVLDQRLVRKICSHCRQPYKPSSSDLKLLGYGPKDMSKYSLFKGSGCPVCNHTGYKGSVAVFEIAMEDARNKL